MTINNDYTNFINDTLGALANESLSIEELVTDLLTDNDATQMFHVFLELDNQQQTEFLGFTKYCIG